MWAAPSSPGGSERSAGARSSTKFSYQPIVDETSSVAGSWSPNALGIHSYQRPRASSLESGSGNSHQIEMIAESTARHRRSLPPTDTSSLGRKKSMGGLRQSSSSDELGTDDAATQHAAISKDVRTSRQRKKHAARQKGSDFYQDKKQKRRLYWYVLANKIDLEDIESKMPEVMKRWSSPWEYKSYDADVIHVYMPAASSLRTEGAAATNIYNINNVNTTSNTSNINNINNISNINNIPDIRNNTIVDAEGYGKTVEANARTRGNFDLPLRASRMSDVDTSSSSPSSVQSSTQAASFERASLLRLNPPSTVSFVEGTVFQAPSLDAGDDSSASVEGQLSPSIGGERIREGGHPLRRENSEDGDTGPQQFPNQSAGHMWSGYKEVFIFEFGPVIFWGFSKREERQFLDLIADHLVAEDERLSSDEFEAGKDDMTFAVSPEAEVISINNDVVTLPEHTSAKSRLSVSFAVAQSAVLAIFEHRSNDRIEKFKFLPETLATCGSVKLSPKALGNMIGEVYVIRHDVNLHTEILDTPDFFWKEEAFTGVYQMTMRYLEMENRTEILNKRLDMLRELLQVLQQQHENVQMLKLEWIIIWLIVASVAIEVINMMWSIMSMDKFA